MKKMKMLVLSMTFVLLLALAGCGNTENTNNEAVVSNANNIVETTAPESSETSEIIDVPVVEITADRAGNEISIPEEVNTIVSLASSTTQVLSDLGLVNQIVAVDSYSIYYTQGLAEDIVLFDMMQPDLEALIALNPDIVFVSEMSNAGGEDIFAPVREAGITVATIPTPDTIDDVKLDVQFIADAVHESEKGTGLIAEMDETLSAIQEIAQTITEPKTVAYEVSGVPYLYSTGAGTYVDEMIRFIGAKNVYEEQSGWISVTEEDAVSRNPDVILTSVNYEEDVVNGILARAGWENVSAVANKNVFYIDNASCTLPNQHIIQAMTEMAKAIYPEAYANLGE